MTKIIRNLLCILALAVFAGPLSDEVLARESRDSAFKVQDLKTQELRYLLYSSVRPIPNQPGHWAQKSHGQGRFHTYDHVDWQNKTEFVEKDGYLWPVKADLEIFQKGVRVERWSHMLDFVSGKIKYYLSIPRQEIKREFIFPIKGPTINFTSMALFLEDVVPRVKPGQPQAFLLVTSEPRLFRVSMKYVQEEEIPLVSGRRQAIKYRLIADMGILDDVFDRWIPPTFIWYDSSPPYHCIKYQGMETGEGSAVIDAELIEESVPQ